MKRLANSVSSFLFFSVYAVALAVGALFIDPEKFEREVVEKGLAALLEKRGWKVTTPSAPSRFGNAGY